MTLAEPVPVHAADELPFRARVDWDSFNELAKEVGSAGLRDLPPGTLAHLRVKQDAFIIAREAEFQVLVGLAADAARLHRMVLQLTEGVDIAADQQDPRILAWLRGVAEEFRNSLMPQQPRDLAAELLADLEGDSEPAPRSRQPMALATGG